jgi:hypothetical protein
MSMEDLAEWELARETEVLGGNQLQSHFVHHKSHTTWSGIEAGLPLWEPGNCATTRPKENSSLLPKLKAGGSTRIQHK